MAKLKPKAQEECTYVWRGTAPFCNGECHPGEVYLGKCDGCSDVSACNGLCSHGGFGNSCFTGNKALCSPDCNHGHVVIKLSSLLL